ncbi:glycoprotein 3-alpha-L-fucosyltransferase A-like [Cucumis melo var. makuwa]|uniref:Glycoprotein 3-alpha-L-fucosyltransferase A-like n=1 Tax=Cucumis melo var. makuwa TaxID=1194695 RepID=A0A5D3DVL4_CUCMM|nr:glycoprotein 3-alpha-L-fucosyltransferase A-like [Cucumis melo var. makuwa]TYK27552.1 glycoprotein 3-alpha-L-fucosyltransferase A-like [Cucumis melo var. makuwa]
MSITVNQRGSRSWATAEELPVSSKAPMSAKKKWSNAMPMFIALVVVAEINFLGRLDVAKNVAMVDSWADLFYRSPPSFALIDRGDDLNSQFIDGDRILELGICEEWLEKEDAVTCSSSKRSRYWFLGLMRFQEVDDNNHEALSLELSKSVGLEGR